MGLAIHSVLLKKELYLLGARERTVQTHFYKSAYNVGRLGFGNEDMVSTPKRISALSKVLVRAIACGFSHSMCLSDEGVLYTWGKGQGNSDIININ